MSRYLLVFQIKSARGSQTSVVDEADSPEHALELHNKGESELIDEEIEILCLSKEPEIFED